MPSGGVAAASKLLALEDRPTAIFAANDVMAYCVMDIAEEYGLRMPEICLSLDSTIFLCPPIRGNPQHRSTAILWNGAAAPSEMLLSLLESPSSGESLVVSGFCSNVCFPRIE